MVNRQKKAAERVVRAATATGNRRGTGRADENPLAEDLDHVLDHTRDLWEELRGGRIFITGGTGFFGCWLLESLLRANKELGLNAKAVVLTRDPGRFVKKAPHLAGNPAVRLLAGDVRTFRFPRGSFSHAIHAAVEADDAVCAGSPLEEMDVTVLGTRRVLDFARQAGLGKLLFTSTGAVYGRQPPDMARISEDFSGAPDPVDFQSRYAIAGEAKRAAESMCVLAARQFGLEVKIARCFSFIGPGLPLDSKFAAGNFLRDALAGGPIVINGDGTAVRSYLYAGDMAVWLWTILFRGVSGRPYNVGSEEEITIRDLAKAVGNCFDPPVTVRVMKRRRSGEPLERYIPSTARARIELGLSAMGDLPRGILKMKRWAAAVNKCNNRIIKK
ncbi:MAG: epimerase [Deltaproteobacteria bacterium HGW-Deltaproteobacteria-19]|jgi:dTDP-glucose 4,6-dehydratase|nr:MAG: epimerase [Deltaproteobacteria bacterium HGW-Deltaproteobacteria-19]